MDLPELQKFTAGYAEDGSLRINDGPPAVGREAIAEVAREFMRDFPDMVVTMDKLVSNAQGIVFHWTLRGTNTGPGGAGKRVRVSGYEEWQLDERGQIRNSLGHFDSAEYERQLQHGAGTLA
jgi:predicted ester cyclase